ncbi:MAG: hypothetical protein IKC11_01315 [Clostridia bacterium]|nr:hypothetical protein [Clostridia bacterium]
MDLKKNYENLNNLLSAYGLSYQDIQEEFTRQLPQKKVGFSSRVVASHIVVPLEKKIYPQEIANGSYSGDTPTLKDWFEYDFRNETIMANLGNQRVISALQRDRDVEFISSNDNLYLYDDGNHRLFNYLLLYLVESKSAKTEQERKAVEEKFALKKSIHFEHNRWAIERLQDRIEKKKDQFPSYMRSYIYDRSMIEGGFGDYIEYNNEENCYNTVINGVRRFGIAESNLEESIAQESEFPDSSMIWENDGTYYIAYHNRVVKTQNREVFKEYYKGLLTGEITHKKPQNEDKYIIEYDFDNNSYSVFVDTTTIMSDEYQDDFQERVEAPYISYIKNRTQLFHKMNKDDVVKVLAECKPSLYNMVYIPERKYENMTAQECKNIVAELDKEIRFKQDLEEKINV